MLCKGSVVEQNRTRSCWLPAEPFNSFQLCRRCHFQHITKVVDSLIRQYSEGILCPTHEQLLNDTRFLQELLHPAREQALLNLLVSLFEKKKIQFQLVFEKYKKLPLFPIVVTKRIQQHHPGPRCSMYRHFLKDKDIYTSSILCWNCWSCIAWTLKQRDKRLLRMYDDFGRYVSRINLDIFHQTGHRVFLDYFVSLHLLGKDHHIRILFEHFLHVLPIEEFRSLLFGFFTQIPMLYVFYEQKQNDFLPAPFQDPFVLQTFKEAIKNCIKRTTDTYKEDLMIKTWHPRRLFPWCMDIQEWEEFGVSSANCSEVYRNLE